MRTVWKFPFDIQDEFTIQMPRRAQIVLVEMQKQMPCLWAEIEDDDAAPFEDRTFAIVGTGHMVPPASVHVASFQQLDLFGQSFIWHLYEQGRSA